MSTETAPVETSALHKYCTTDGKRHVDEVCYVCEEKPPSIVDMALGHICLECHTAIQNMLVAYRLVGWSQLFHEMQEGKR